MYYQMYDTNKFSKKLLDKTKELTLNPDLSLIDDYLDFIVSHYNISKDKPKTTLEDKKSNLGRGCYIRKTNEIILYGNIELITVLHEIRHFIQFNTIMQPLLTTYQEREEDARGWSSSLFYAIYPTEYLELANKGKIKFI